MLSKGISAPSGLQCSQDSISRWALSRVAASMSTTFWCSGVGSKKSRLMRRLYHQAFKHDATTVESNVGGLCGGPRFPPYRLKSPEPISKRDLRAHVQPRASKAF